MDVAIGFEGTIDKPLKNHSSLLEEGYRKNYEATEADAHSSGADADSIFGVLQLTDTTSEFDEDSGWKTAGRTNRSNGSGINTNERDALLDRRIG